MCREKWTMLELENSKERSGKCLLGEKKLLLLKSLLYGNLSAILSLLILPAQVNTAWQ